MVPQGLEGEEMRRLIPLLLLGAAMAQTPVKQWGVNLTAVNSTQGVTFTWFISTTPGGEDYTKPYACGIPVDGPSPPNQCWVVGMTPGVTFYFTSVASLVQSGVPVAGPPSQEGSIAYPIVPSASTVSAGLAQQ